MADFDFAPDGEGNEQPQSQPPITPDKMLAAFQQAKGINVNKASQDEAYQAFAESGLPGSNLASMAKSKAPTSQPEPPKEPEAKSTLYNPRKIEARIDALAMSTAQKALATGQYDETQKQEIYNQIRQKIGGQVMEARKAAIEKRATTMPTEIFKEKAGLGKYGDNTGILSAIKAMDLEDAYKANISSFGGANARATELERKKQELLSAGNTPEQAEAALGQYLKETTKDNKRRKPITLTNSKGEDYFDEQGEPTAAFKRDVYDIAKGDPSKFKQAATDLLNYNIGKWDATPSRQQKESQEFLDWLATGNGMVQMGGGTQTYNPTLAKALHAAPYAIYQYHKARTGGVAATLAETAAGIGTLLQDGVYSSGVKRMRETVEYMDPQMRSEADMGKAGVVNSVIGKVGTIAGDIYGMAGVLGGTSTLGTRALEAATKSAKTGAIAGEIAVATGQAGASTKKVNAALGALAQTLNSAPAWRIAKYADNLVGVTQSMGMQVYNDYTQQALQQGYAPKEADGIGLKRAIVNTALEALVNPLADEALRVLRGAPVGSKILNPPAPKTGKYAEAGRIVWHNVKTGTGEGSEEFMQNIADSYFDHQEGKQRGEIPEDAEFDWGKSAVKALPEAGIGFLAGVALQAIGGHGIPPKMTQAKMIADAIDGQQEFNASLERAVKKGKIAPENAAALKGFIKTIAPTYEEAVKNGMKDPYAAVQYAVEKARNDEASIRLEMEYAKAEPNFSLIKELSEKTKASAKAMTQIINGTYLKDRVITGEEMAEIATRTTPNFMPAEQLEAIVEHAPYKAETISLDAYKNDPKIAEMAAVIGNPDVATAYKEKLAPLVAEAQAIEAAYQPRVDANTGITLIPRKEMLPKDKERLAALKAETETLKGEYKVLSENEAAIGFKPQGEVPPVIDANGNIIDGQKRIAAAIANGEQEIEVVRPVTTEEANEAIDAASNGIIGVAAPVFEGLDESQAEILQRAAGAFEKHPNEPHKGYEAAARVLHEAGVMPKMATDMLHRIEGQQMPMAMLEHIANRAAQQATANNPNLATTKQTDGQEQQPRNDDRRQTDDAGGNSPMGRNEPAGLGAETANAGRGNSGEEAHGGSIGRNTVDTKEGEGSPVNTGERAEADSGGATGARKIPKEKVKTVRKRKKPTIKDPRYRKALSIDFNTPYHRVLQYFIAAGRIHTSAIQEIFGRKGGGKSIKGERNARIWAISATARTINQLAHALWEESISNQGIYDNDSQYTDHDYREAIIDALSSHVSRTSMAEEIVKQMEVEQQEEETGDENAADVADWSEEELEAYLQNEERLQAAFYNSPEFEEVIRKEREENMTEKELFDQLPKELQDKYLDHMIEGDEDAAWNVIEQHFNQDQQEAPKADVAAQPMLKKPTQSKPTTTKPKRPTQKLSDKAKQDLDALLDDLMNLGITTDPEKELQKQKAALKFVAKSIEYGIYKLADMVAYGVEKLGVAFDTIYPYIKRSYLTYQAEEATDEQLDQMDSPREVRNFDYEKFKTDVHNQSGDSQSDSEDATDTTPEDEGIVSGDRRESGDDGKPMEAGTEKKSIGTGRTSNGSLFAPAIGIGGNNEPHQPIEGLQPADGTAGTVDGRGNSINGTEGIQPDGKGNPTVDKGTKEHAGTFAERIRVKTQEQIEAEGTPFALMDEANIRKSLPYLLPEQQDDVIKAETRYNDKRHKTQDAANGKGMLFTNGTGTGKTYTALGVVKRFAMQGKKNVLVVVPSQEKVTDWQRDARKLLLNLTPLEDTKDGGKDMCVTTYANFRANEELLKRDFDLVVYDESHRLMESKTGEHSSTTKTHYLIANKDEGSALTRLTSVHPLWKQMGALLDKKHELLKDANGSDTPKIKKLDAEIDRIKAQQEQVLPALKERAKRATENTKVLFLSATPFKAHFNLRYANGFLFDWGNETTYQRASNTMSRVDAESRFFLDNFGSAYEWKFHRLQTKEGAQPEAIAMQEIQFAERLMAQGAMSGRTINSEQDYSREFPIVSGFNSEAFNRAFNDIFDYSAGKYSTLRDAARGVFYDYNYTTQLFESLRTSMSIDRIKKHLALGRKVVVFHRRQQANSLPPFRTILDSTKENAQEVLQNPDASAEQKESAREALFQADRFEAEYADLLNYEQTLDYRSAVEQLKSNFPEQAVFFNGNVSPKEKSAAVKAFNQDGSGKDIFVVQEEAGKEGISLHDTTGKHQRVNMSLSLPISTVTTLQIEGRTYRIGQETDAIFEYPLLGLDLEVAHFGQNLNKRLSTTENLAVGSLSRDLTRSIAEGVLFNSNTLDPNTEQGKGGKEFDKKANENLTAFQKAKLVYATNQKTRGRRDQRAGTDYFATPEPVGQKMVEWAGLKPGEAALEPSAGHGAIAMWLPNSVSTTAIEPSFELYSKLTGRAQGASRKILNQTFEGLNIINKFDAVIMNPPFGTSGKTAMDHIEKAFKHLHDGGRIVALVPNGGAMQKRINQFLNDRDEKGRYKNPSAHLRAEVTLPPVTFEQAGTSVGTKIIIIDKATEVPEGQQLMTVQRDLSHAEKINDLFDAIEHVNMPERIPVAKTQEIKTEAKSDEQEKEQLIKPVEKHTNTRTGETQYKALPAKWLGDDYKRIAEIAKKHNGGYSKFVKGFLFNSEEDANAFVEDVNNNTQNGVAEEGTEYGLSLFEPTGASNEHVRKTRQMSIFEQNEATPKEPNKKYTPQKGKGEGKGETIRYHSNATNDAAAGTGRVQRENTTDNATTIRGLKDGEICHAERILNEQGHFSFTGNDRIESTDDVAYLFRHLEEAVSENAFVAMAKEDGTYQVLYLSTGGTRSAVIDVKQIYTAAKEMGAQKIWLVHNHPSGSLKPSPEDIKTLRAIRMYMEGSGVTVEDGVIINLDSGKYVAFNETNTATPDRPASGGDYKPSVKAFDQQKLYTPAAERTALTSVSDVAIFLSKQKRGTAGKIGILIIGNNLEVRKYLMEDGSISQEELLDLIKYHLGKSGEQVILVSNDRFDKAKLAKVRETLRHAHSDLVDAIEVSNPELLGKMEGFISYASEGLMEPQAPYGQNEVREETEEDTERAEFIADLLSNGFSEERAAHLWEKFKKWKQAQAKSNPKPRAEAAKEAFDSAIPAMEEGDNKPMAMPELVELAKMILGNTPFVKKFREALGKFYHNGTIGLHPELFKEGNEIDLARVLAHEIGHANDWLSDKTMDRGNIGGRIASLHTFLKTFLPFKPGAEGELTKEDKARLRELAKELSKPTEVEHEIDEEIERVVGLTPQMVLDIWNSVDAGANNPELLEYIKNLSDAEKKSIVKEAMKGGIHEKLKGFVQTVKEKTGRKITIWEIVQGDWKKKLDELIAEEIARRKLWNVQQIHQELKAFSAKWRPWDEAKATETHKKYRNSSTELYADAISALLTSPGYLKQQAPKFYEAFHNYIEKKPEFREAYQALQEIMTSPEDLLKHRTENILRDRERAREVKKQGLDEEANRERQGKWARTKAAFLSVTIPFLDKIGVESSIKKTLTEKQKMQNEVEALRHIKSLQDRFVSNTYEARLKRLGEAGIDPAALHLVLLYDRIEGGRRELANPGGHNPVTAAELKAYLLQNGANLGVNSETVQTLLDEAKTFHDEIFAVMKDGYDAGLYTKEQWEIIEKNKDSYATFTPVKYAFEKLTGGIIEAKGTLEGVADAIEQTVLKAASVQAWTIRNRAAAAVEQGLKKFAAEGEVYDSQPITRDGVTIGYKKRNGYKTIAFMREGKQVGIDVKPEVALIFEKERGAYVLAFTEFNNVFKPAVTSLNLGFALYNNPIRDISRTITNLVTIIRSSEGNGSLANMVKIPATFFKNAGIYFSDAYKYAKGETTEFVEEIVKNKGLARHTFGDYETHYGGEDMLLRRQLGLTANKPEVKHWYDRAVKPIVAVFDFIKLIGGTGEVLTKIAGNQTLRAYGFDAPTAAFYTRKVIGTPDYMDKGEITPWSNTVLPFSNVMLQALRQDVSLMTSKGTRSAYWMSAAMMRTPSILMALAAVGFFGEALKDLYDEMGEYDKSNYLTIPIGRTETGKVIYWRVPIDEIGRLQHVMIYKGITYMAGQGKRGWADIAAIGAGFTPSLSPLIKISKGLGSYVAGGNIRDEFYDKDVLTKDEALVGGPEARNKVLVWIGETAGFGYAMKILTQDGKGTWYEHTLKNAPAINRMIKVSNQGEMDEYREVMGEVDKVKAQERMELKRMVQEQVSQTTGYTSEQYNRTVQAVIKQRFGKNHFYTAEDKNTVTTIKKLVKLHMVKGSDSPDSQLLTTLMYANNEQRKQVLQKYREKHGEEKYKQLVKQIGELGLFRVQ